MKQLIIDRFEGVYAICEDKEEKHFAIPSSDLPEGAKEGCVLVLSDDGELTLDLEETQRRRQRLAEKLHRLVVEE